MLEQDRGQLIVSRTVTQEQLEMLAPRSFTETESGKYKGRVSLSVWDKESVLQRRPRISAGEQFPAEVLVATFVRPGSKGGRLVFDPYRQAVLDMDDQEIEEEMKEDGYLRQVAVWASRQEISRMFAEDRPQDRIIEGVLEEVQARIALFDQPRNPGFRLDDATLQLGNVEFDLKVSVALVSAQSSP